jgi:hypothetical protein
VRLRLQRPLMASVTGAGASRQSFMAINWQDVITTIGGQGVLLAAVAWLFKAIVSNRLTLDAEKFKTRLKADADIEIVHLKSALQAAADERQVRFANLHEKRAGVLEELNNRLVDVQQEGERFVFVDGYAEHGTQMEAYIKANEKLREFYIFVEKHRIYLPEHVCTLLKNFMEAVRKTVISVGVYGSIENPTQQTLEERNRILTGAFQAFEGRIPDARRALEEEFRRILGVEGTTRGSG